MEFQELPPYCFNPWKHHLQWVITNLKYLISYPGDQKREGIITHIKSINSNQVDIYTGQLSPKEIIEHINLELHHLGAFKKPDFLSWLHQQEFHLITLTDSSIWVIREGIDDERYIHFHPARNSPNTVRLHGNSWKTAIAVKLIYPNLSEITLSIINKIRQTILNLSPIKDLKGSSRWIKAFELLKI